MRGRRVPRRRNPPCKTIYACAFAAMALAAVCGGTSTARAESGDATAPTASAVQFHEVTLHAGLALYSMLAVPIKLFAGPKLTPEYARRMTDHLWLDASLGLIRGSCMQRSDERVCVLVPGYAIEPLVGIKRKTTGSARAFAYAKLVVGALVVVPDNYPVGAAALFRTGGGAKVFVSDRVALGIEITGALGFGKFEFHSAAQHVALNVDLGLGVEVRF